MFRNSSHICTKCRMKVLLPKVCWNCQRCISARWFSSTNAMEAMLLCISASLGSKRICTRCSLKVRKDCRHIKHYYQEELRLSCPNFPGNQNDVCIWVTCSAEMAIWSSWRQQFPLCYNSSQTASVPMKSRVQYLLHLLHPPGCRGMQQLRLCWTWGTSRSNNMLILLAIT